jgi:hypothetical protein
LDYYREMGVNHFLFVDNDSTDGTMDYLAEQPDVSVWHTRSSYKRSRFGADWLNTNMRTGIGHWSSIPTNFWSTLFVIRDPLRALTDWLDASSIKSFSAMMLDMYPKGRLNEMPYQPGQNSL